MFGTTTCDFMSDELNFFKTSLIVASSQQFSCYKFEMLDEENTKNITCIFVFLIFLILNIIISSQAITVKLVENVKILLNY